MKDSFKKTVHNRHSLDQETIEGYKAKFQAINPSLDPGPSMYFMFNHHSLNYEYLSGAIQYIMGYTADEFRFLKEPYLKFFHEDDLPIFNNEIFPTIRRLRAEYADQIQHIYYQTMGRIQKKNGELVNTLMEYQVLEIDEENRPILSFGKMTEVGLTQSVNGIGMSMYIYDGKVSKLIFEQIYPFGQSRLTKREIEVLKLIAEGKSGKEIAAELFISENTMKNHRQNIFRKLNLKSSQELVRYAIEQGLVK